MTNEDGADDKQEKPCCIKLKQKLLKAENGRRMLREAIGILENGLQKSREEIESLKQENENTKRLADNENKTVQDERRLRMELETAHNSLKTEFDSLRKKLAETENKYRSLEQRGKEEKKKESYSDSELKKLKGLLENEKKALELERKKSTNLQKRIDAEMKKAGEEKARADAAIKRFQEAKTADDVANASEQRRKLEKMRLQYEEEKNRADAEKERADNEKIFRDILEKKLKDLESESRSKTEGVKATETKLNEKLQRESENLKSAEKRAQTEKAKRELLEREVSTLKEQLDSERKQLEIQSNKVPEEEASRHDLELNHNNLRQELSQLSKSLKLREKQLKQAKEKNLKLQTEIHSVNVCACKNSFPDKSLPCKTSVTKSSRSKLTLGNVRPIEGFSHGGTFVDHSDFLSPEPGGCNPGTSSVVEPLYGGSVETQMQSSGLNSASTSVSNRQLIKSQDGDAATHSGSSHWRKHKKKHALLCSKASPSSAEKTSCQLPDSVIQEEDIVDSKNGEGDSTGKQIGEDFMKRNTPESLVDSIACLFSKEKKTFSVLEEKIEALQEALKLENRRKRKRGGISNASCKHLEGRKVKSNKDPQRKKRRFDRASISHLRNLENNKRKDENLVTLKAGALNSDNCLETHGFSGSTKRIQQDEGVQSIVDGSTVGQNREECKFDFDFETMFRLDNEFEEEQYCRASECLLSPTFPQLPDDLCYSDSGSSRQDMLPASKELWSSQISCGDKTKKNEILHFVQSEEPFRQEKNGESDSQAKILETEYPIPSSEKLVEELKVSTNDLSILSSEQVSSQAIISSVNDNCKAEEERVTDVSDELLSNELFSAVKANTNDPLHAIGSEALFNLGIDAEHESSPRNQETKHTSLEKLHVHSELLNELLSSENFCDDKANMNEPFYDITSEELLDLGIGVELEPPLENQETKHASNLEKLHEYSKVLKHESSKIISSKINDINAMMTEKENANGFPFSVDSPSNCLTLDENSQEHKNIMAESIDMNSNLDLIKISNGSNVVNENHVLSSLNVHLSRKDHLDGKGMGWCQDPLNQNVSFTSCDQLTEDIKDNTEICMARKDNLCFRGSLISGAAIVGERKPDDTSVRHLMKTDDMDTSCVNQISAQKANESEISMENKNKGSPEHSESHHNQQLAEALNECGNKNKEGGLDIYLPTSFSPVENFLCNMLVKILNFSASCFCTATNVIDLERLMLDIVHDGTLSKKEMTCIVLSSMMNSLFPIESRGKSNGLFCPNEASVNWSQNLITQIKTASVKSETKDILCEVFSIDILLPILKNFLIDGSLEVYASSVSSEHRKLFPTGRYVNTDKGTFMHLLRTATHAELRAGSILTCSLCLGFGHVDYLNGIIYDVFWQCKKDSLWLLNVVHSLFFLTWEKSCQTKRENLLEISVHFITAILERREVGLSTRQIDSMLSSNRLRETDLQCISCPFSVNTLGIDEVLSLLLTVFQHPGLNDYMSNQTSHQVDIPRSECQSENHNMCFEDKICNLNDSMRCLELIALYLGWEWTYNQLVPQLWRMAQPYTKELIISALFLLLGNVGRLGMDHDRHEQYGVEVIRKNFSSFLEFHCKGNDSWIFGLASQAAAAQSLLKLIMPAKRDQAIEGKSGFKIPSHVNPHYKQVLFTWYTLLSNQQKSQLPEKLRADICALAS